MVQPINFTLNTALIWDDVEKWRVSDSLLTSHNALKLNDQVKSKNM